MSSTEVDLEKGVTTHHRDVSPLEEESPKIHRVHTSGKNNEIVHIGDMAVYKEDLMTVFGEGTYKTGGHQFGNPMPLGMVAFGLSSIMTGFFNAKAQGVTVPNVMVGTALFFGGMVQILVAMWELAVGETFGATTFATYGSYYLSFGAIITESFGVPAAYAKEPAMFNKAMGLFCLAWTLLTFVYLLLVFKGPVELTILFVCIFMSFLLSTISYLTGNEACMTAGGVFTVVLGFDGFYLAYLMLANPENAFLRPKPLFFPWSHKPKGF